MIEIKPPTETELTYIHVAYLYLCNPLTDLFSLASHKEVLYQMRLFLKRNGLVTDKDIHTRDMFDDG